MKTEILTAVLVLALVIVLGRHLLSSQPYPSPPSQRSQIPASRTDASISLQNPMLTDEPTTKSILSGVADSNSLIVEAARTIMNLPPLEARLRYKIDMFGQQFSGPGRYFQKGEGTRLARIEFQFGSNASAVQLHQFCDGDFLYSLTIVGDESNLEFVDLRELNRLNSSKQASAISHWLSVGSVSGLLDQLAQHFNFDKAVNRRLNTIPIVVVTGRWKNKSLCRLLEGQVDPRVEGTNQIDWRKIPEHLPHQVELTLGNHQQFPMFPHRVVFQQFENGNPQAKTASIAELEFYELRHAQTLNDSMFQLPSVKVQPNDATEFYRQRVKQFAR